MANITNVAPTQETYDALLRAFRHFNADLFQNRLAEPLITLNRSRNAHGYFWAERWLERADEDHAYKADEIALNPETMGRDVPTVLSTLVHEMTHQEQQHFGTPGKGGFHNKEWGDLMDAVGLTPTDTGQPGGKRTGRKMTHMIEPGGPFALSVEKLLAEGFTLPWHSFAEAKGPKRVDKSKTPFCCPECAARAWAKPTARLICGECEVDMEAA